MTSSPNQLVRKDAMVASLERATTALTEAKTILDTKRIIDVAVAAEAYAKQVKDDELYKFAYRTRTYAMRRCGELLTELKNAKNLVNARRKIDTDAFILKARLSFDPGEREPCQICGLHKAVTQAHHLMPLSVQAEQNYYEPDQSFAWLCPTHHVAIHILLNHYFSQREFISSHVGDVILMMSETYPLEQYETFLRLLPGFDPKKKVEI